MKYSKKEEKAVEKGFIVSEEGIAYNKKGDKVGWLSEGYMWLSIRIGDKSPSVRVHRIQAYQKYGDKLYEPGIMVRHLDGNPLNNSWDNIVIGTNKDNQLDIPKQLRVLRSLKGGLKTRKYDKDKVKEFHAVDKSYKKTMEEFGISSKGTLYHILKK